MKPKSLVVLLMLVVVVVVVIKIWLARAERIPPDTLTRSRMIWAEMNIREYAGVHGRLPNSLSELPKRGANRDDGVDGWGRPIQYRTKAWTVTLSSLGKDGHPGGAGQDADITVTFTVDPEQETKALRENES